MSMKVVVAGWLQKGGKKLPTDPATEAHLKTIAWMDARLAGHKKPGPLYKGKARNKGGSQ